MNPHYFETPAAFRKWLAQHHLNEKELLVGFHKVKTGKPCMSWSDAVDEALCYGWIDGIRKSLDEERYTIRFSIRRPGSIWSKINLDKIKRLTVAGRMKKAGLDIFNARAKSKTGLYSHENSAKELPDLLKKIFMKNKDAWQFFLAQPPSYRKRLIHWVTAAKQEKTKQARLERLIASSAQQKRML